MLTFDLFTSKVKFASLFVWAIYIYIESIEVTCRSTVVKIVLIGGVVGWCEGAVYLTSLGRPTDIGLHLGKACYPCSG